MKITIDVSTMQNRFAACGRDYYSLEGYEALLAYYNDIDPNMELDAVAICGDCTEYGEGACCSFDDLINDKGYAYPIEDYKADNDIETDDEFDQDDYIVALVKKLEQRTTVLHVSNGNYIIFLHNHERMISMNEYLQQAQDFLAKTNATMQIDFVGFASNTNWKESTPRAMYQFKLTTPKGSMTDTFWDSINNTAIQQETIQSYAESYTKPRSRT